MEKDNQATRGSFPARAQTKKKVIDEMNASFLEELFLKRDSLHFKI
jgi:hypothetical protein